MADAKVIGMDGRARSARTVLAGADRASGERVRRRRQTTPLLSGSAADSREARAAAKAPGATPAKTAAKKVTAKKPAATKAPAGTNDPAAPAQKAAKKSAAKRAAAKKAAAQPGSAATATSRTPVAGKPRAKKTSARQTAAKKSAAEKSAAEIKQAQRLAAASAPSRPMTSRTVKAAAASTSVTSLPSRPAAAQVNEPEPLSLDAPLPSGGRHSVAMALVSQAGQMLLEAVTSRAKPAEIESKVASILSFVRHRLTGDYELDEFGFDPEFTKIPLALLKPLYKHWFRVEVRGIENIPAEGGGLVVANHSGTLPMDAIMTAVAIHETTPNHQFLRTLGADLVFQTPFLAGLARRAGATLASNPDAERLLSGGHLVGVWPEGFKGIGKPFSERYKLQRFGRGGFVSAALRTGTPIIPCSIVGAEEIFPIIGDIPSLARLLGLPYVPITPFFPLLGPLGAIPLPSKWLIEFGPPVETAPYGASAADDPMLVFDLTDQVRQSIQQTLYSLLVQRRSIFF